MAPNQSNVVIVVPGLGGDGGVYTRLVQTLQKSDPDDCRCVADWGSSWPVFLISISSTAWHHEAEQALAERINQWRDEHPRSRIALIAHSAGAGVVAGALADLAPDVQVGPVILLAPDLSPDFDLNPALRHVNVLHVFFSSEDDFFQGLGPEIVGTYDRVYSEGAGRRGFMLAKLDASEKAKVVQHAYRVEWKSLGNVGGHYDWMADPFVTEVVEPLIVAGTSRSSEANSR